MKNLGLAFLVMFSLVVVSCGKKDGGGGSSGFSSEAYSTQDGKINWTTGVITVDGKNYNPQSQQVSPASYAIISNAFLNKGNVSGITQSTGQGIQYIFRVRIEAIESHFNGQRVLDIRSMKFINYNR